MNVQAHEGTAWLLLAFTLPAKHGSKRVEVWRKLQRYGTVPLGNSGYLLPSDANNEERFQWLATAIRRYGGEASVVRVESIDNLSPAQLKGRFNEARVREYQELIRQIQGLLRHGTDKGNSRLARLRNRFQEIVEIDFFDSPLQLRVRELLEQASSPRSATATARVNPKDYKNRVWV